MEPSTIPGTPAPASAIPSSEDGNASVVINKIPQPHLEEENLEQQFYGYAYEDFIRMEQESRKVILAEPSSPYTNKASPRSVTFSLEEEEGTNRKFSCRQWRRLTGRSKVAIVSSADASNTSPGKTLLTITPEDIQQTLAKWQISPRSPLSPRARMATHNSCQWLQPENGPITPKVMKILVQQVYASPSAASRKAKQRNHFKNQIYRPNAKKTFAAFAKRRARSATSREESIRLEFNSHELTLLNDKESVEIIDAMKDFDHEIDEGNTTDNRETKVDQAQETEAAVTRPNNTAESSVNFIILQEPSPSPKRPATGGSTKALTLWCPQPPHSIPSRPGITKNSGSRASNETETVGAGTEQTEGNVNANGTKAEKKPYRSTDFLTYYKEHLAGKSKLSPQEISSATTIPKEAKRPKSSSPKKTRPKTLAASPSKPATTDVTTTEESKVTTSNIESVPPPKGESKNLLKSPRKPIIKAPGSPSKSSRDHKAKKTDTSTPQDASTATASSSPVVSSASHSEKSNKTASPVAKPKSKKTDQKPLKSKDSSPKQVSKTVEEKNAPKEVEASSENTPATGLSQTIEVLTLGDREEDHLFSQYDSDWTADTHEQQTEDQSLHQHDHGNEAPACEVALVPEQQHAEVPEQDTRDCEREDHPETDGDHGWNDEEQVFIPGDHQPVQRFTSAPRISPTKTLSTEDFMEGIEDVFRRIELKAQMVASMAAAYDEDKGVPFISFDQFVVGPPQDNGSDTTQSLSTFLESEETPHSYEAEPLSMVTPPSHHDQETTSIVSKEESVPEGSSSNTFDPQLPAECFNLTAAEEPAQEEGEISPQQEEQEDQHHEGVEYEGDFDEEEDSGPSFVSSTSTAGPEVVIPEVVIPSVGFESPTSYQEDFEDDAYGDEEFHNEDEPEETPKVLEVGGPGVTVPTDL